MLRWWYYNININIKNIHKLYNYIKEYYPQLIIRLIDFNNDKEFDTLIDILEKVLDKHHSMLIFYKEKSIKYHENREKYNQSI